MITKQHKHFAQDFADALTHHDVSAFDSFIAVDYRNHNAYVAPGREGVKAFFSQWLSAFPDTHVTLEQAFVDGDTVIGQFTYRGTHLGPFLSIAPTGRSITMRSIDIWHVRDGYLIEHWDELNLLEVFQQLGIIPPIPTR